MSSAKISTLRVSPDAWVSSAFCCFARSNVDKARSRAGNRDRHLSIARRSHLHSARWSRKAPTKLENDSRHNRE